MNSTKEQFTELLLKELKSYVGVNGQIITLKSRLEEDLDVDSLDIIDFSLELEDKHKGIDLIDKRFMDIKKMKTVENLRDFIWDNLTSTKNLAPHLPENEK